MDFNILKNIFNNRPQVKNKYDYNYALNIDGVREKLNDTNVFVAVQDKFSLDYVLYLRDKVENLTLQKSVINRPKRPMYELGEKRPTKRNKSSDLLTKNISDDLTQDLRELVAKIIRMVYCDIHTLIGYYERLVTLRVNDRETFTNMQNQARVYKDVIEQIYYTITNTDTIPPCSEEEILQNNNFCATLLSTYEHLDRLVKKLLRLSRSVQIAEINKQLDLMLQTFNNQMNIINNFLLQC